MKKNDIGSILINDEENICIMINEEDHLRIQVFSAGFDIENTLNLARELDEKLNEALGYAVSKQYGYLTQSPSDCGTGLRASVMVHLPGLKLTENIEKVFHAISNFGINIRGIYGENSKSIGDIFQISNEQSLGISEKEIAKNLKVIVEKVINQERSARKLLGKNAIDLEDKVYRSYGVLSNCRKIGLNETLELLSDVKLGVDLGILKEISDAKVQKLYILTKPANLQKYFGNTYETVERDSKRAELIKKTLIER
jgi:protein arginine kinase